jgi:hypothetical protein
MRNTHTIKNKTIGFIRLGLFLASILVMSHASFAQSVQNSANGATGEYGAISSIVGSVRNTTAVLVGGRGGWILSPSFSMGIAGYTLVNDISGRQPDTAGNRLMTLSYGGIDLEYTFALSESLYLTFQELIGAGSISHRESPYHNPKQYHDPFAVFEPSVSLEVGVSKIFRIGIGASYREVEWLDSNIATRADLGGPSGFLFLKIGFL